jgi:uncharacterized protein
VELHDLRPVRLRPGLEKGRLWPPFFVAEDSAPAGLMPPTSAQSLSVSSPHRAQSSRSKDRPSCVFPPMKAQTPIQVGADAWMLRGCARTTIAVQQTPARAMTRHPSLATLPLHFAHEIAMLLRLLFWIILIVAAVWFWRRLRRAKPTAPQPQEPAPMVRCAQCRVHLPQREALQDQGLWYCSQRHLEQGPSKQ